MYKLKFGLPWIANETFVTRKHKFPRNEITHVHWHVHVCEYHVDAHDNDHGHKEAGRGDRKFTFNNAFPQADI